MFNTKLTANRQTNINLEIKLMFRVTKKKKFSISLKTSNYVAMEDIFKQNYPAAQPAGGQLKCLAIHIVDFLEEIVSAKPLTQSHI
ncbi:hypothetical protein GDO86_006252 [Hymenochirus boettgeri]|uniref:Uncharacterized protein n=1 Tax=Hymenochirus boettgeri TaxID=247094 RepID=A0A8T2JAU6_9PIPI|nr:hypothetical protein GDO86_006252 [Hymenochirus boettgeri]